MARQEINVGTAANDGTGDTLRGAGEKINDNFAELYYKLGGDSDTLSAQISLSVGSVVFEGSTADSWETELSVVDPTADRAITFPDASGEVILDSDTQTLTNKTLTSPVLTTPQINDTSADHQYVFAVSELAADRTVTLPLLTGNDEFVFKDHTQTLTNKTLTSPAMTTPKITTAINDTNGAELVRFTATTSAVNDITVTNAIASDHPSITASGSDTNVDLELNGKNTGAVVLNKQATNYVEMTANGTASSNFGTIIGNKGTALAITLGNGTRDGEHKNFINVGAGDATITPSTLGGGTSVTIQQNECATFFWYNSSWYLLAAYNGTLNP